MEDSCHTLPSFSSHPTTLKVSLPSSSSSPRQTSSRVTLPLSPISFPPSPVSLSPATAEFPHSSSPLSHGAASHCLEGQSVGQESLSDQNDLTCLSWLHQRGNLLPLQPLTKMTLTPQQESCTPAQPLPSPASSKPPYSFSSLIFMAIEDSPCKRLPVKEIYDWIVNNFPYYRTATSGWRNSVRHNLSLSKSFRRIERDKKQSVGKGSLWCVCPEYRPALLEMLRKTHSFHSTNSNLINKPALLGAACKAPEVCDSMDFSDPLSHSILLSSSSSHILTSNNPDFSENTPCPLTPDHEELVTMELTEYPQNEVGEDTEKDPLSDSGYIELHYYQSDQYQYLVLPDDTELDLETVEILQLDVEAQEAAGSLLDLAGGGY
ncbi:forkhead box protein N2 [Austrofundulus limnaeus]|uniref:Forkhead box protein N2-like n=1 Tax=Austrofundulus limnaeus TaxID=52670 RepID=A0A2I4AZL9_AUSLI|nr:PREDICTED: forkhead box protein N2-like [Austrofundulus limnaeus]XP_013860926.1 PREDICTED: forkhead box protein N2-like [Austrofundulus limnaeus]